MWDRKGRRWPFPATDSTRGNVDRERNMFARRVGGSGREGENYSWVLSVNGQQIQYDEKSKNYSQIKGEVDMRCYISCIEVPDTLKVPTDQVKRWIEEVCYAETFRPSITDYVPMEKIKVQVIFGQIPSEVLWNN